MTESDGRRNQHSKNREMPIMKREMCIPKQVPANSLPCLPVLSAHYLCHRPPDVLYNDNMRESEREGCNKDGERERESRERVNKEKDEKIEKEKDERREKIGERHTASNRSL